MWQAMLQTDSAVNRRTRVTGLVIALVTYGLSATSIDARSTLPPAQPRPTLDGITRTGGSTVPRVDPGLDVDWMEPLSEKLDKGDEVAPPWRVDTGKKAPMPEDFRSDMPDIPPPSIRMTQ